MRAQSRWSPSATPARPIGRLIEPLSSALGTKHPQVARSAARFLLCVIGFCQREYEYQSCIQVLAEPDAQRPKARRAAPSRCSLQRRRFPVDGTHLRHGSLEASQMFTRPKVPCYHLHGWENGCSGLGSTRSSRLAPLLCSVARAVCGCNPGQSRTNRKDSAAKRGNTAAKRGDSAAKRGASRHERHARCACRKNPNRAPRKARPRPPAARRPSMRSERRAVSSSISSVTGMLTAILRTSLLFSRPGTR